MQRLFSYIVAFDSGSAPNPNDGMCSLAICKPAIRRTAKPGDWVIGLDEAPNNLRIVYAMRVEHSLSWEDYIATCGGKMLPPDGFHGPTLHRRIPQGSLDPGDCIWTDWERSHRPLDSYSGHDEDSFVPDVLRGGRVLISRYFWYFGDGEKHTLHLPESLRAIVPGRGHQSTKNQPHLESFVVALDSLLQKHGVTTPGVYGAPKLGLTGGTETERARCRRAAIEDDAIADSDD